MALLKARNARLFGWSPKACATRKSPSLYSREYTVRNYLFRIFEKLGISSRVEPVLYAFSGVDGDAP